jgi:hypothetical protein
MNFIINIKKTHVRLRLVSKNPLINIININIIVYTINCNYFIIVILFFEKCQHNNQ